MAEMTRRDLLSLGLTVAAVSALPVDEAVAAMRPLSTSDVAARLLKLRNRTRHMAPPSPRLIKALEKLPHTALVYDLAQVEENYLTYLEAAPGVDVHYAVKAGPNPRVLQRVAKLGGGFDVASRTEVNLALATGVAPEKCVYSNTVKYAADIRYAFQKGIRAFVADAEHEVRKQAEHAPGSKLYVRLLVDNPDAAHPLGEKFGTTVENAKRLLRLGKELGLEPYGTHFHVGTQCYSAKAWRRPIRDAAKVFRDLRAEGIELKFFDIGGGYPTPFLGKPIPSVKEILDDVQKTLREELPDPKVILAVEPGRGIVGTAAVMSSRVMLRAERAKGEWIHLDVGTYHGLGDAVDHLVYPATVPHRTGAPQAFTLCGPTCDTADTISKDQELPSDITEGDMVIFDVAGAYSECLWTRFNGIEPPKTYFLEQLI